MKKIGIIIGLFGLAIILVIMFSHNNDYIKTGNIYINEIVASNSYTHKDGDGEYSDYIEIYNGYDYDINLHNYRLSDSLFEINKWKFPDITINSHEYLLIYSSGKNKCLDKNNCHTNFKLKSEGETISFIDDTGNIISRVTFNNLMNDESLSFIDNKYTVTPPTPGKENNQKGIEKKDVSKYHLLINEYMSHNKGATYASDGTITDWVELYNPNEDISLEGLAISDDEKNLNKYILPDRIIKKNNYVIIYLNDGIKINDEIVANFRLSDQDEKLILSLNGKIIDEVKIVKLEKNVSYGRSGDKWLYFLTPTPGKENTTYGVERMETYGDT